jgi:hypothetical protein
MNHTFTVNEVDVVIGLTANGMVIIPNLKKYNVQFFFLKIVAKPRYHL